MPEASTESLIALSIDIIISRIKNKDVTQL